MKGHREGFTRSYPYQCCFGVFRFSRCYCATVVIFQEKYRKELLASFYCKVCNVQKLSIELIRPSLQQFT